MLRLDDSSEYRILLERHSQERKTFLATQRLTRQLLMKRHREEREALTTSDKNAIQYAEVYLRQLSELTEYRAINGEEWSRLTEGHRQALVSLR